MIQVVIGIVVAIWFLKAAGKVNLHRGKWVFIGLVSFLIPSIIWAVIFFTLLRKPILESILQYNSDGVVFVTGFLIGSAGPLMGFVLAYVVNKKYLTSNNLEAAARLEKKFAVMVISFVIFLLLNLVVLYLANKYWPEIYTLKIPEPKFNYTLF